MAEADDRSITIDEFIALAAAKGYSAEMTLACLVEYLASIDFRITEARAQTLLGATHREFKHNPLVFAFTGSDMDSEWWRETRNKKGKAARAAIRAFGIKELDAMTQDDREEKICELVRAAGLNITDRAARPIWLEEKSRMANAGFFGSIWRKILGGLELPSPKWWFRKF